MPDEDLDGLSETPDGDPEDDLTKGRFGRLVVTLVARHGWRRMALGGGFLVVLLALLGIGVFFVGLSPWTPPGSTRTRLALHLALGMTLPLALALPVLAFSFRAIERLLKTRQRLLREIERRLGAEERLRRLATTDELTGLDNRRQFLARGREAVALARRYGQWIALLALDIDRFKAVNDRLGHKAGDAALVTLADALRDALRSTDLPARFGGDEFMVLMPLTDRDAAVTAAERIRAAFARNAPDDLTLSVGVAAARGEEAHLEDLMARSDLGLYDAKRGGRDRVRAADARPEGRSQGQSG
ncbi:MAG: GGDEF domain-containing protein [Geminicoccaceae bacterium]|nr:GGDEF domain-containing protein [Geminicoccaceae bacterium]